MLSLGMDTGGTYTDAVIVDLHGTLLASAKALTTHANLVLGIREALDAVIAACPGENVTRRIAMVSLSTTLATNAIVEGRGSRAGLVMIGSDDGLASRGGLREALDGDPWIRLAGGHDASGAQKQPLDTTPLAPWLAEHADGLRAFAVCAEFGSMNPGHEITLRAELWRLTGTPVTCAHELSGRLNAPRRALTALLNARLLPRITELMDAVQLALHERAIPGHLMVVKGDGSLLDVCVARERPVETILSGPAASVVGAAHLAGDTDVMVADIGGTTTDIAILREGRPRIDPMGASVGGFRTLVNAAAVHSVGLGGDSTVALDNVGALEIGPRRILPVCRLVAQHPDTLRSLRALEALPMVTPEDLQFVWRSREPGPAPRLRRDEQPVWACLDHTPQPAARVAPDRYSAGILQRMVQRGMVSVSGLTPTDAAHALGLDTLWSGDAACMLLEGWQRMRSQRFPRRADMSLAREVLDTLATSIALALLDAAFAADPGEDVDEQSWRASRPLLRQALSVARSAGTVYQLQPRLTLPLVAVGASAATHFPAVRDRLHLDLRVPAEAGVTNALGAVVGAVVQQVDCRITSPEVGLYRLHGETEQHDFTSLEQALASAEVHAREQAVERARRAGAPLSEVVVKVEKNEAVLAGGETVFVEACVSAIARGRPARTHDTGPGSLLANR